MSEKSSGIAAPVDDLAELERKIRRHVARHEFEIARSLAHEHAARTLATAGERSAAHARSLFNLAQVEELSGWQERAFETYSKSLEILQTLGEETYAQTMLTERTLATLRSLLGKKLTRSEALYLDRKAEVQVMTSNGLAKYEHGDLDGASRLLSTAISLCDGVPLLEEESAIASDNLGVVKHDYGELQRAEQLHLRALRSFRRLGMRADAAIAMHNLGSLYSTLGRPEADKFLQSALEAKRALGDRLQIAMTLAELGAFRLRENRPEDAAKLLEEAVKLYRDSGKSADDPLVLKAVGNLQLAQSWSFPQPNQLEAALQLLEAGRKSLPPDHPDLVELMLAAARAFDDAGRYPEAKEQALRAVTLARRVLPKFNFRSAAAIDFLLMLLVRYGDTSEAAEYLGELVNIEDHLLCEMVTTGTEQSRLRAAQASQAWTMDLLDLLVDHFAVDDRVAQTVFDALLHRKGLLLEASRLLTPRRLSQVCPSIGGELEHLKSLRRQMAEFTLRGPQSFGMESAYAWQAQRRTIAHELLESEMSIRSAAPPEVMTLDMQKVDLSAIANSLPKLSALIEIVLHKRRGGGRKHNQYLAFVLRPYQGGAVSVVRLGDADRIDRLVTELLGSILPGGDVRSMQRIPPPAKPSENAEAHAALTRRIVNRLNPRLRGCDQLIIAPDGALYRLPFHALLDSRGRRLGDKYRISYVDTGRDVLRFGHRASALSGTPTVFVAPDFDLGLSSSDESHVRQDFGPLSGTLTEGREVANRLGILAITGPDALEPIVRDVRAPAVLHVATHGYFIPNPLWTEDRPPSVRVWTFAVGPSGTRRPDPARWTELEDPLVRCGLAFAGVNAMLAGVAPPCHAGDGILSGLEVLDMDLEGTQLAVLSACETGLGDDVGGEGPFGLRRAFSLAGAESLLLTLWKVHDDATCRLMCAFYDAVLDGVDCASALQAAQRAMMRDGYPTWQWAAFMCYGDPGPLDSMLFRKSVAAATEKPEVRLSPIC